LLIYQHAKKSEITKQLIPTAEGSGLPPSRDFELISLFLRKTYNNRAMAHLSMTSLASAAGCVWSTTMIERKSGLKARSAPVALIWCVAALLLS
jgi:hypothetical protein